MKYTETRRRRNRAEVMPITIQLIDWVRSRKSWFSVTDTRLALGFSGNQGSSKGRDKTSKWIARQLDAMVCCGILETQTDRHRTGYGPRRFYRRVLR